MSDKNVKDFNSNWVVNLFAVITGILFLLAFGAAIGDPENENQASSILMFLSFTGSGALIVALAASGAQNAKDKKEFDK